MNIIDSMDNIDATACGEMAAFEHLIALSLLVQHSKWTVFDLKL